jgi:serine/threonine-protein kinase
MRSFGRFEVVAPISRGGMADVYRCRLRGMGGFEKVVVVKRIRADRAGDPSFVGMFLDEARLAACLSHPNIVQVYEIGEADGTPYIAMEYVAGPTLAALVRQLGAQGERRPHGHLARILADVCAGLHEAHTARDARGQLLGIVHRDVSPQNIVVSRQGVAKLLDFGVAKANDRLTETRSGSLKGKLRYMAPERLDGIVDPRADVFAAGVCLFEATVGASPFGAEQQDDIAVLRRIASGRYARPGDLVPDYPPALEQIVLQAIEPDPARRCPSARALQEQLEHFVAAGAHRSSATAVASWAVELCPPDGSLPAAEPATTGTVSPATTATTGTMPGETPLPAGSPAVRTGRRRLMVPLALASLAIAAAGLHLHLRQADRPGPPPAALASARAPSRVEAAPPAAARAPLVASVDWQLPAPRPPPVRRRPPARRPRLPAPMPATVLVAAQVQPVLPPAAIHSRRPHARVPPPRLPRLLHASDREQLARTLAEVEHETLKAGCSPEFVQGITDRLRDELRTRPAAALYPSAIYYFIVREAGLGREKSEAAAGLAAAHASGAVRALASLPSGAD